MPPKASGRPSARSAISKNSASSPPKSSRERDSASPVGRRTRSTRSPSVETRNENAGKRKVKTAKGTISREGSVESVGSINSTASKRGARARQGAQTPTRALTPLAEDGEEEDEDSDKHSPHLRSPGAVSQLSGTTAITSHSQSQVAHINPGVAVEFINDLLSRSQNILDLLAPVNVTEKTIPKIVKELKILNSGLASRLKRREKDFDAVKEHFGTDEYIQKSNVFKGLWGTDEPGEGDFRPDAILYAANVATLVNTLVVAEQKSPKTFSNLMALDARFCLEFVDTFEEGAKYGGSSLWTETFNLGLAIRTQCAITNLRLKKDNEDFDPDLILASAFYKQPNQRDLSLSDFEDYSLRGQAKDVLRDFPNSEHEVGLVYNRLSAIKECFRENREAVEAGDLVDYDQLEESFPWIKFLEDLVKWARFRFDELDREIQQQGGVENIQKELQEGVKIADGERSDSQSDVIDSGAAANSDNQPDAIASRADDLGVDMDDNGVDENPPPLIERPAAEYASSWQRNMNEKNKENLTSNPSKRSVFDAQPEAQAVDWDDSQPSQEEVSKPSRKRQHAEVDDEDEAFEQDQRPGPSRKRNTSTAKNAQSSGHHPNPSKRMRAGQAERGDSEERDSTARRRPSSAQQSKTRTPTVNNTARQSSSRREQVRMEDESDDDDPARSRRIASNTARPSGRRTAAINDDPVPGYSASQVAVMAREETARSKVKQVASNKRRIPWSEADSELLVHRIEEYGCAWAMIHKLGNWEHERDQVALKDRARNMKVTFLKSGLGELPMNFEHIRLGQKEVNSVRSVIPDYEPEP